MDAALEELEREDRLREAVSARVGRSLRPVLDALDGDSAGAEIAARLAELKSRLEAAMALIGGQALESEEGFQKALDEWVERESAGGLHVVWQRIGRWPAWSQRERLDALMILCEACGNARRHGGATEVRILVRGWAGGFSVTVEDNGLGFVVGESGFGGAGMGTMRLRAQRSGARFFATNRQTGGAVVGWSLEPDEEAPTGEEAPSAVQATGLGKALGMELHDDLCQRLVGALLELAMLRAELPEERAREWIQLKDAEERLRRAYERIRGWSHELIDTNALAEEAD
jgi:nitrate/nitrite-specific signal transduction histidine kinase